MVGGFDREEFRRALLNEARSEMLNVSVSNNMNQDTFKCILYERS